MKIITALSILILLINCTPQTDNKTAYTPPEKFPLDQSAIEILSVVPSESCESGNSADRSCNIWVDATAIYKGPDTLDGITLIVYVHDTLNGVHDVRQYYSKSELTDTLNLTGIAYTITWRESFSQSFSGYTVQNRAKYSYLVYGYR